MRTTVEETPSLEIQLEKILSALSYGDTARPIYSKLLDTLDQETINTLYLDLKEIVKAGSINKTLHGVIKSFFRLGAVLLVHNDTQSFIESSDVDLVLDLELVDLVREVLSTKEASLTSPKQKIIFNAIKLLNIDKKGLGKFEDNLDDLFAQLSNVVESRKRVAQIQDMLTGEKRGLLRAEAKLKSWNRNEQ